MLKWWWVIALVAAIGIAIMTWMTPRGAPVEFHPAERKVIREYIEEEAKTRLPDVVRITMPLQGRILPIELREGDRVTAGQVVARLDPGDLDTDLLERANTVRRYDKNLQQIDLSIEQAEQTVKASQAKYDFAERLFSRTKALASRNSTTQTDLERDEFQMTEAALDLRKEQLNKGLVEIMRGVLELMRESDQARKTQAERDRERAELRCPIDGVVLKAVESNERVMVAGELLLELGKPEDLEIESDILTQDVATIEVGDRVDIEGSAIGKQPIAGRVVRIYPQGFTKVSSLGVEQQRVKVIIEFEPGVLEDLQAKHRRLGVDYRVRVKIETAQKDNALTIPRVAVFRNAEGNWQTFVVRKGRAALTNIVIGLRNDFDVEILSGLSDSDQVILAPDSTLVDGALVESIDDAK